MFSYSNFDVCVHGENNVFTGKWHSLLPLANRLVIGQTVVEFVSKTALKSVVPLLWLNMITTTKDGAILMFNLGHTN